MAEPILKLVGLSKYFPLRQHWMANLLGRPKRILKAVDRIDLMIPEGQTFGLVGESGCGKSTLGRVLCTLLDPTDGQIYFRGQNLRELKGQQLRRYKKEIQIVFQDPYSSLDPRMTIFRILERPLIAHGIGGTARERKGKVFEMMGRVGLDEDQARRYPHEFSGGQRQRIAIARALVLRPRFVVADEPVSALDVSVQAQILNLFIQLQEELNLTYLFISHDLTVVRHVSDWTGVMYLGRIVEWGKSERIFESPLHPYTLFLLASAPKVPPKPIQANIRLQGEISSKFDNLRGCRLLPRCPRATTRCETEEPSLQEIRETQWAACWNI